MSDLDDRASFDSGTVGDRLRAARESAGLTVSDVADRTRIPTRHLESIETGQHGALPSMTYSTGFVKTYARMVGLDGIALARDWREEAAYTQEARPASEPYAPADPARTPTRGLAIGALILALLLGLGYVYWRGAQDGRTDRDRLAAGQMPGQAPATLPKVVAAGPAAPPSAAPVPSAVPVQAAASGAVVITAVDPTWLKVYEMGGATLFMGLLDSGKTYEVPATAVDPRLLTGRPGSIRVTVGTTVVPPLGDPRKTVKDVPLKPAALLARTANAASAGPAPAAPGPVVAGANSVEP